MIDNYPPGAANDPRAPWNQQPKLTQWKHDCDDFCDECDSVEPKPLNDDGVCESCFEAEEIEEDYPDDDR